MKKQVMSFQKTALALAVGFYAANIMAYQEQGQSGNTSSWESAEYLKDWGLVSMNASTAYAMGFNGSGVNIGVMDSGVLMSHPEFQDGRIHTVVSAGKYSKDGMRYPDAKFGFGGLNKDQPFDSNGKRNFDKNNNGDFVKGGAFSIDGGWHKGINDSHGTHVGGTMAASRNGEGMHGVAFGANLYSANTGGTDNMTYGPNQDYEFFLQGYSQLAANGAKVINNSWGSNRRVNSAFTGAKGYSTDSASNYQWQEIAGYGVAMMDIANITETTNEKDVMYLKDREEAAKAYYQFATQGEKSFLDAAYEVAKEKGLVQVFTAGNRSLMAESFTRASLPYFRPDAEKYWVNVTGQRGGDGYPNDVTPTNKWWSKYYDYASGSYGAASSDIQIYNYAGDAKWWTIAAPATNIYSAYVHIMNEDDYGAVNNDNYGSPIYKSSGGTSMAAPHVSGALGVILSRYPYMSADQARDVMLTTARQTTLRKGLEGQPLERWESAQGVPSKVWGWGILDLGKAMFGPGQLLGEFKVNLDQNDLWSNDISDKAIKARQLEDQAEAQTWSVRKAQLAALMQNRAGATAEEQAEYQVGLAREAARNARALQGYQGALVKNGQGTLTLTGNNTFTGKIIVNQGVLAGLNQSLATAENVVVNQGAGLDVLTSATVVRPSATGLQRENITATAQTVTATINQGGSLLLNDGVANLDVTFAEGAMLTPNLDEKILAQAAQDVQQPISVEGSGHFRGAQQAQVGGQDSYAFFSLRNESNGNRLKVTAKKQAMSTIARTANEVALANALDAATTSSLYSGLLLSNRQNAYRIFDQLNYDSDLRAQQHNFLNDFMLHQQLNQTAAQRVKLNSATQLWTTAGFNRLTTDNLTSHSYNQLLGADFALNENGRLGLFFGATQSRHKVEQSSKDRALHLGVYGEQHFAQARVKVGFIQTWGKHEQRVGALQHLKTNSQTQDVFAELGYNLWPTEGFTLEPYAAVGYMHVKSKGASRGEITLNENNRDVVVTSVGVRPSIPFIAGGVQFDLTSDVAYHRFHKDRATEGRLQINNQSSADVYSEPLKDVMTAGVALQARITPALSVKLGYQGAYNHNTKANNINAELRFLF